MFLRDIGVTHCAQNSIFGFSKCASVLAYTGKNLGISHTKGPERIADCGLFFHPHQVYSFFLMSKFILNC